MWIIWTTLALAAPPGFRDTKTTEHCQLMLAEAPLPNGVVPMRAECHWPDVTVEHLDTLMSRFDAHASYFSSVTQSETVPGDGPTRSHQVHRAKGISDRECVLRMSRDKAGDTITISWTLDNGDLEPAKGRVLVAHDDGFWQFSPHPDGGARVVHQLAYDPGGTVPGFLVRWFQTSGLEAVVEELEAAAHP
jgi:hypothetical protein